MTPRPRAAPRSPRPSPLRLPDALDRGPRPAPPPRDSPGPSAAAASERTRAVSPATGERRAGDAGAAAALPAAGGGRCPRLTPRRRRGGRAGGGRAGGRRGRAPGGCHGSAARRGAPRGEGAAGGISAGGAPEGRPAPRRAWARGTAERERLATGGDRASGGGRAAAVRDAPVRHCGPLPAPLHRGAGRLRKSGARSFGTELADAARAARHTSHR